jgi:excisionase family DNA binding protein
MRQGATWPERATPAPYLTPEECARLLRVSRASIYRAVARGDVQAVRLHPAGALRIPRAELERVLAGGVP